MRIVLLLGTLLLFLGLFLTYFVKFFSKKNKITLEKKGKKNPNICILIPARDESKVIENLLISIEQQSIKIPSKNIYVIVESEKDPTVKIVKKHQMNYFVRKKLDLKTKGYALEEMVEDLVQKNIYYDVYFIFDADNVLDPLFIENMLKDYQKGYAVSTGYRSLKNTDSYFPVSAGLTYFLVNEVRNRLSLRKNGNIILSGTGYYIHGNLIKKWQTFPFHSFTEDYESSLYYTVEGISTNYREDAIFYDEQPTDYKTSINQRSRWIKGYFTNWFQYQKKFQKKKKETPHNLGSIIEMQVGILPIICIVLGIVLIFISLLIEFSSSLRSIFIFYILLFLLSLYIILILFTIGILWVFERNTPLKRKVRIGVILYHPIFLISYVHAFFVFLFHPNLSWNKIEHGKKDSIEVKNVKFM